MLSLKEGRILFRFFCRTSQAYSETGPWSRMWRSSRCLPRTGMECVPWAPRWMPRAPPWTQPRSSLRRSIGRCRAPTVPPSCRGNALMLLRSRIGRFGNILWIRKPQRPQKLAGSLPGWWRMDPPFRLGSGPFPMPCSPGWATRSVWGCTPKCSPMV